MTLIPLADDAAAQDEVSWGERNGDGRAAASAAPELLPVQELCCQLSALIRQVRVSSNPNPNPNLTLTLTLPYP